MFKSIRILSLVSCLGAFVPGISACSGGWQSQPYSFVSPVESYGIEGQWVDASGITSSFRNGIFETRSADTHEKLAEGNYAMRANSIIEIEMRSLVRGTVSRVNCSLANAARLLCTPENGPDFTLARMSS